jgi:hypothetical protein
MESEGGDQPASPIIASHTPERVAVVAVAVISIDHARLIHSHELCLVWSRPRASAMRSDGLRFVPGLVFSLPQQASLVIWDIFQTLSDQSNVTIVRFDRRSEHSWPACNVHPPPLTPGAHSPRSGCKFSPVALGYGIICSFCRLVFEIFVARGSLSDPPDPGANPGPQPAALPQFLGKLSTWVSR